jgi:hypothetical protein
MLRLLGEEAAVTIIWFTDEDRERMRAEADARAEYNRLFEEFVREVQPFRIANREPPPFDIHKMMRLDIRPWPEVE